MRVQAGSIVSQLHLSPRIQGDIARSAPILAAILVSAGLCVWGRRKTFTPAVVLGTVVACLCLRTIFESDPLDYYLLPASVGLLVLGAQRRQPIPAILWFLAAGVWYDTSLRWTSYLWVAAVVYLVLGLSAVVIGLLPLFTGGVSGVAAAVDKAPYRPGRPEPRASRQVAARRSRLSPIRARSLRRARS